MLLSRDEITPNNYSPVVSIVTWILLISMALSVCTKIAIKAIASHSFDADDAVLFAAMVTLPMGASSQNADSISMLDHQCSTVYHFLYTDVKRSRKAFELLDNFADDKLSEGLFRAHTEA